MARIFIPFPIAITKPNLEYKFNSQSLSQQHIILPKLNSIIARTAFSQPILRTWLKKTKAS